MASSEQRRPREKKWTCDGCSVRVQGEKKPSVKMPSVHSKGVVYAYCERCATICSECKHSIIFLEDGEPMNSDPCEFCRIPICTDCEQMHYDWCSQLGTQ